MHQSQERLTGSLCLPCYRSQKGMYLTCASSIPHTLHVDCMIALDKHPGVRPIGTGDSSRRIIAKAVLSIIGPAIQDVSVCQQLCGGQISGIEGAIHAAKSAFESEDCEAALLIDATDTWPIEQVDISQPSYP